MLILISDAFGPDLPGKLTRFGEVTTDHDRLAEADVVLVRSKTCRGRPFCGMSRVTEVANPMLSEW